MKSRMRNIIFSVIFITVIVFFGTFEVISVDKDISHTENRNLTTFSDLKTTSYIRGDFQSVLESAMADQFLGRYQFVNFKNELDYLFNNIAFIGSDFDYILRPLSNSGVMQIGNSKYMIDSLLTYDEISNKRVLEKTEQINSFAKRNDNVKVYTYLPVANHESGIFDEPNGVQSAGQRYIKTIEDNIKVPFQKLQFDSLEEIKEFCFSSDHHLNHNGSYRMYTELLSMLGKEDTVKVPKSTDCHVGETFYGTYSSRTGYVLEPSEFCVNIFDLDPHKVFYENREIFPKTPRDFATYDMSKSSEKYPYYYNLASEAFEPLSFYDFNQSDKENVLLVTDSLTRPIIDVFASTFNKTYRLIPYDYTKVNGDYFDYDNFIKENDIDIVVFAYGLVNYYYQDEWGDRFLETTIMEKGE